MYPKTGKPDARAIALPLYIASFMFVVMPMVEMVAQLGATARPDNLQWRTGTVGLLSSAVLTPTFGLFLGLVVAYFFGHRWAHRMLTIVCGVMGLLLFTVTALFVLDAFQLRATLNETVKHSFGIAMAKAVINLGIAATALFAVAVTSWRAGSRLTAARAERREAPDVPLIVRSGS